MINKKVGLKLFLVVFLLFVIFPFVAAEGTVCCQKLIDGNWCQNSLAEQCDLNFGTPAPTSCEQTSYCSTGTCIDTDQGSCMPNTPKLRCESEGGTWDPQAKEDIAICQNGCCMVGDGVAFVTQAECKQLATDYSINTTFRGDISTESMCFELSTPTVKGACVLDSRDCLMTTKEDCLSKEGDFNEGFLCTATHLETNCAKTENTRCDENGKVYFLDSCNNLANVYDSSMFTKNENEWTIEMENYWISLTDAICSAGVNCGNCNYIEGSTCKEYNRNNPATPTRPEFGDNVCADLGCNFDTDGDGVDETYEHGESWCASSEGVYPSIKVDPLLGLFQREKTREDLLDVTKYNLPGSRYYKLNCMDGEVITEPCKDYRNEYCVESSFDSGFKVAQCRANNWRDCYTLNNRTTCEDTDVDCKWIPGYRYDGEIMTTDSDRNEEDQGSCVPLYAPGFDFWNENNDGLSLCLSGAVTEAVVYETHWAGWGGEERDEFEDVSPKDAAERCLENCYLIPGYAKDISTLDMENKLWHGEAVGGSLADHFISLRKGHYCDVSDVGGFLGGDGQAKGTVKGNTVGCADTRNRNYPIFFTHEEWISSLWDRTRSLGDCGYKSNFLGKAANPEVEIVTAMFQKLKQDGSSKGESESEKIYEGNDLVIGEYRA